jgi:hypothetical protein
MAAFNLKIATNLQNNDMEAKSEPDGTSDYAWTPRLLEHRSSILFVQKYDFYYRSFFIYMQFFY